MSLLKGNVFQWNVAGYTLGISLLVITLNPASTKKIFFHLGKISSKIKCQHSIFELWSVLTGLTKNGYLNVARRILLQCLLICKLLINSFYWTGFPWIWKIIWNLAGSWRWCDNHWWQWYVQFYVQKSGKSSFTCNLMQNCRFSDSLEMSDSLLSRWDTCLVSACLARN